MLIIFYTVNSERPLEVYKSAIILEFLTNFRHTAFKHEFENIRFLCTKPDKREPYHSTQHCGDSVYLQDEDGATENINCVHFESGDF